MSDLEGILAATTSPAKETRERAEASLTTLLTQSPDDFSLALASAIGSSDSSVALSAAVIFRRKVLEDKKVQLQASTAPQLRTLLLSYVTPQQSVFFLKRLGDLIASLADLSGWMTELPGYISAWATSDSPALKELAMYLLELSTEYESLLTVLKANAPALMTFLVQSLQDPVFAVQSAAAKAVCAFLTGFEEEQAMTYAEALAYVLNVLSTWVQTPDFPVDKVKSCFESLSELTEQVPKIWGKHMDLFTTVVCGVVINSAVDCEVRITACETAITLLTQAPSFAKKHQGFLTALMTAGMKLTSEVDDKDDLTAWSQDFDDESIVQNTPFSVGRDLLNKVAVQAGQLSLPYFLSAIPEHLKSADWTLQHTGLLAIGTISEGCHEAFSKNLGEILNMLMPFFNSENPRLRWAALTSLGLLCTEFEPIIEETYHALIFPAFLTCMNPGVPVKVQTQAAAAVINYIHGIQENEDSDCKTTLGQYSGALFSTLTTLLQSGLTLGCLPLLREVLDVVSVAASALKSDFQGYYDHFMPGLKNLVSLPAKTTQEKTVRAGCIRCMGYLVESAVDLGPTYTTDANTIFAGLSTLRSTLEFDDPAYLAISEVASFFASCIKEQFVPYLSMLVPDLLSGAKTTVDMSFVDAESPEAKDLKTGMNAITLKLKGQGAKQFSLNTSALDTKVKACRITYDLVHSLGKLYSPWVPATLETMTELFRYVYSSDIRKFAFKTVGACSGCCGSTEESHLYLRQLLPIFMSTLKATSAVHPLDTKHALKALQWWFEETQNLSAIGLATANELAEILAETVKSAFTRKVERQPEISKLTQKDTEDEELEELQHDGTRDDEIVRKVMEVTGSLLKSFKTQFQPAFLQYFKNLYAELFIKQQASDVEVLSAVCIFDDYVEHTGDVMPIDSKSLILEQLLRCCSHTNPDIRQSAIFGVGLCAQFASAQVWATHKDESLRYIQDFIQDPKARSPDLTVLTDCAVSSLGKIALYQDNGLIDAWLTQLPIKAEPEEAQAVHKLFLASLPKLGAHQTKATSVLRELARLVQDEPSGEVIDEATKPVLAQALAQLQA